MRKLRFHEKKLLKKVDFLQVSRLCRAAPLRVTGRRRLA
jgi:hypothetical protein